MVMIMKAYLAMCESLLHLALLRAKDYFFKFLFDLCCKTLTTMSIH